jgi:hypothetical protein
MPSTIARNWMIGHHIISTISGHDHRPLRRGAPLRPHREMTSRFPDGPGIGEAQNSDPNSTADRA